MAYNYHENVVADVETFIRDEIMDDILEHFEAENLSEIDKDELKEYINDKAWTADNVTGNGSGSYTFNAYRAEEALIGNDELIAEMLKNWVAPEEMQLGSGAEATTSAECLDVSVRCYELSEAIEEAIENVLASPEKQVAEGIETKEIGGEEAEAYFMDDFRDEVRDVVEAYIIENIDELLETADINSVEDYENTTDLNDVLIERIQEGYLEMPEVSDREAMHHIDEVLNVPSLYRSGITVADYFDSEKDIKDTVKEEYAREVAIEEIGKALENTYEQAVEPALEQREENKENVDRDE